MVSTYECWRVRNGVPTIDKYGNYVCCIRDGPNGSLGSCVPIVDALPYPNIWIYPGKISF